MLGWTASSDDSGVAGYDVYRDGNKVASPTATSVIQNGLACGKSYALEVSARDAAGNASPRALLTVSTGACTTPPADTTPPSTPSGLGVSGATRTSVLLGWNASIDNSGVAGYRVYVDGTYTTTATQLSATILRLSCGTAYTFGVEAVDAAGNASVRASVTGSTTACPDIAAPTAPTNLVTTSRTATSVALSWSASNDDVGVTGYGLYRGGSSTGTSSTTTGIFSGLACGTNYTLAVDANDAAGNRSPQTVVMVSTTACPDTTAAVRSHSSFRIQRHANESRTELDRIDRQREREQLRRLRGRCEGRQRLLDVVRSVGSRLRDVVRIRGRSARRRRELVGHDVVERFDGRLPGADVDVVDRRRRRCPGRRDVDRDRDPHPDSVEFWESPVGGASKKLKTDTSAPYDVVLNLAPGSYVLGVCSVQGTVRTCFDDRKNVTISATSSAASAPAVRVVALLRRRLFERQVRRRRGRCFSTTRSPGWTNLTRRPSPRTGESPSSPTPLAARGTLPASSCATPIPAGRASPDVQKAEVRTDTEQTFNKSAVSVGDVRWFSTRIYLPYNANEKFEWAHGGSQPYTSLFGLHTGSSTGWSAILMGWNVAAERWR